MLIYFYQLFLFLIIINYISTQLLKNNNQFIICNLCNCLEKLKIIECFPINKRNEFRLQKVKLPEWTEIFIAINISQPEFPQFIFHSNLKKLSIKNSKLHGNNIKEFNYQLINKNKILNNLILSNNPFCPIKTIYLPFSQWIFKKNNIKTTNLTKINYCILPFSKENWNILEELYIDNNKNLLINKNSLKKLFQLKTLYFTNGNIFPEEFFLELTKKSEIKLKYLKLRNTKIFNKLNNINKFKFCSKNMEWLDIGNIGINGELNLKGCKKLKWLYADNNKFYKLNFGESFGPESLLTIKLNSNLFKEWPESLLDVGHSLINLNLANNLINNLPENGKLLLTLFPKLEYLDLANNKLINFELKSSLLELSKPTQLYYLNLSNNQIEHFGNLINEQFLSIKILDLSNNKLKLFSLFEWLPSLNYLNLNQNKGINIKIFNKNKTNNSLYKINLNNCNIKLMPNFNKFSMLKELNLYGNLLNKVPGNLLPNLGIELLDLRNNLLNRIGWDWNEKQIELINELKLEGNPLDCECPMPEYLINKVGQLKKPKNYICIPLSNISSQWQHPLESLDFIQTIDYNNINSFSQQKCKELKFNLIKNNKIINNKIIIFILFLLPIILICGPIGIILNNSKLNKINWSMKSSMIAYIPLYNNREEYEENII
ncbi:hypothetical protein Mgra_00004312 [Meloidogyne graminicola]|uniref:LRRCT domain-containing protein n=1 Tax=Meloidogyne graminicola TaxID=189291 RepID=A0A8S9ZT13_9BILA|nr:hypothetical protein Mgra_00004312 [Meloidogyne graminicola]